MTETIEIECESCKGTGLYVGFLEKDGSAVVCGGCRGSGKTTFSYRKFTGRRDRKGILHVYQSNPGICVGTGDGFEFDDFGGMSYRNWKDGKPFPPGSEMRKYVCPAWWYQGVDSSKKPEWSECLSVGAFSDCKHYSKKDKCWKRWDEEFGKKL